MGNRLGRKKDSIDDRYTRPQGLYQHRDIDHKKLRKLILDSKLAPCYPGDEDCLAPDLEECPICFLYYPSLNRSRCCMKGICTECFLQMKPSHTTRPTQCPFCKTSNYAVEYRGVRTNEEKGKEQIEEQKVIEAKIRMQRQEQSEEEERLQKKQAMNSLNQMMMTGEEVEFRDMAINSVSASSFQSAVESDDLASSSTSHACLASKQPLNSRHSREEEFDLDLEELMVMEAIWLSIQDRGNDGLPNRNISSEAASSSGESYTVSTVIPAESSSTGGLVCAAAALAEHQHFNENSITLPGASSFTVPRTGHFSTAESVAGHYTPERWGDVSSDVRGALQLSETEWATEPCTSYVGSDDDNTRITDLQVPGGMNITNGHLIPETFEEQMMLAMAVSLAEARSRTNTQGVTWM